MDEYGEPKKKPIKKMMYTDIATDHEYSTANTAHSKCEKALEKLRKAIKDLIKLAKSGGRKILFFLSPLSILVGMFR